MIGKVLGERYEIIEKIGGGGMALVYKAKCRLLNRFVAIKILRTEFTEDEEFVKKFKREAQSAASLSHPNIVGIYDVGKEDNIHYIVMEYVKGQTLKDLIKSKRTLNVDFATSIAMQICSAIEHAHNNHIVHRDIKSHNILLREDNSIKVTDFGIARAVSSSTITNTGNIIGSVHYFSPEQARGGYTDEKSDIYSLGVVLYEMITGRLPFEGESPIAIALKHIQEEPLMPSQYNTKIPKSIEDIILKCMEKDVSHRYENADQIIGDLRQSLVMPNGTFVKRKRNYSDENTKIIKPIILEDYKKAGAQSLVSMQKNEEIFNSEVIDNKDKNRKSRLMFFGAIFAGITFALVLFSIYIYVNSLITVKEVEVPDLTNLSELQAKESLNELGFFMEVAERVNSMEVPDGNIISQIPKPSEKNKVTNPIKVVVSKGPYKVEVPKLIGQSYDRVKLILDREGLVEGDFKQEYSEYPYGLVISQSINPGLEVDQGTIIDYVISFGPAKFIMKDYTGMNIDEVRTDLLLKELILQNIIEEHSSEYQEGIVINQSIRAGAEVSRNSVVDIVVSLGEEITVKTKSFDIDLNNIPQDSIIDIYLTSNGEKEKIFSKVYDGDNKIPLTVSGEGMATIEVYVNGSLFSTRDVDFDN